MHITKISQQKRDKNRFNIFIDGVYSFATDADSVVRLKLHTNYELTQEILEKLIKEVEFARWYNACLRLISRRPRTVKEIKDYFNKHEVGSTTQEMVIDKLLERKYLDDFSFARWFIEQRQLFKPKGKRLLSQELQQKGITKDIIADTLNESIASGDEVAQAFSIVEKRRQRWHILSWQEQKQKIAAFLGRRGYNWSTIEAVLKQIQPA